MKLEHQVVSLELAQKMKELGFKQESHFYWCGSHSNPDAPWEIHNWSVRDKDFRFRNYQSNDPVSAYTVAELGEMLPWCIDGEKLESYKDSAGQYNIYCLGTEIYESDRNEAGTRAKMLIYLVENKLITV